MNMNMNMEYVHAPYHIPILTSFPCILSPHCTLFCFPATIPSLYTVIVNMTTDGKAREDIVEIAIKERRANVFIAAPDMFEHQEHTLFKKSAKDRAVILAALAENFVFSSLKGSDCEGIVDYMEPEDVASGTDLIVQGDPADYFYVIQSGTFNVIVGTKKVGSLSKGQSFGETGLLYNSPRNATIRAMDDCAVWKLDRNTFRHLLATAHTTSSADVITSLKSAEILKGLSESTFKELAECAVELDYKKGQMIVQKGEHGALGYFVMQGVVRVTDLPNGIPDVSLGQGQHFGLQAILTGETRLATVLADTDVIVAAISQQDIGEILGDSTQLFLQSHQMRELKSIPLFSEFSSEMISSLLGAMNPKHFVAGEKIIQQGDLGTTFYLIETGTCNVLHHDEEGNEKVVKTLGALQYFGEMALLREEPRSADVVAATDCMLLEVEQATFQRIFGSSSNFSRQLCEVVKGRRQSLTRIQNPVEDITMEELRTIKVLGSGTFGVVTLVQYKQEEDSLYALKAMSIEFIERHKQEVNIIGEKNAMLVCDHPLILKMYSTMRDSYRIFFLLEYCDGGELFNVLHNKDRDFVPEHQVRTYFTFYKTKQQNWLRGWLVGWFGRLLCIHPRACILQFCPSQTCF
jgi:CRP-like cAMP-binding protein